MEDGSKINKKILFRLALITVVVFVALFITQTVSATEIGNCPYCNTYLAFDKTAGYCPYCYKYEECTVDNGVYLIKNPGNLMWFAAQVNAGNTSYGAELVNDIDMSLLDGYKSYGYAGFTPIGNNSNPYTGIFDGNNHTVTLTISSSTEYLALFSYVNGATIQNLTVDGEINTDNHFAASIIGKVVGGSVTLQNCLSTVTINSSFAGDGTHGGLVSLVDSGTLNIQNCGFAGKIIGTTTKNCGGIVGWSRGTTKISNSFVAATFDLGSGDNYTFSRNASKVSLTNCYYLNALGTAQGTQKNTDQFASGEVAWLLNNQSTSGVWKQTIGTDSYPLFESMTVYQMAERYVNYAPPAQNNGIFEIKTDQNMMAFSQYVNLGTPNANAKVMNDINLFDCTWVAIGTESNPYSGTFDGNGKSIDDLYITATSNNRGLFGVVSGGTVKDLTISGKISITTTVTNIGGVVGLAQKGAKIENVTSSVAISDNRDLTNLSKSDTKNRLDAIGGIVGGMDSANGVCTVTKCSYNSSISTQYAAAVGGIVGKAINNSVVSYCNNRGSVYVADNSSHVGGIVGSGQTGTSVSYCMNFNSVTFEGTDCIGGIVGYANENVKITYCGNVGKINSTQNGQSTGGILGYVNNQYFGGLENCFNYGQIGTKGGAIVGTCNENTQVSAFKNNYYLTGTASVVSNTQTILNVYVMTAEQFKSGEVAYLLNGSVNAGAWKQNLGTDSYPNFSGGAVYYGYVDCTDRGYTNSSSAAEKGDHPEFDGKGFCTKCDGHQPAVLNSSVYEISNAGQLFWFAEFVNQGNSKISAVLMNDIDLENRIWTPIGLYTDDSTVTANRANTSFSGTFDGRYYVIYNLSVDMSETNYETGLFSRVQGGVLKNFGVVNASVTQNSVGHENKGVRTGVIAGEIFNSKVENVFAAGTLSVSTNHSQKGGIAGECASSTLASCFTTYSMLTTMVEVPGYVPTVSRCYYMADTANSESYGVSMTAEQFASGEVAYLLNGSVNAGTWKQNLGSDSYPNFTGKAVYYWLCKAENYGGYANSENGGVHETKYENGFCIYCDGYQPCNGEGTEDSPYLIGNAGQLYWFAAAVNGNYRDMTTANYGAWGTLTEDITVNSDVLNAEGELNSGSYRSWTPICGVASNKPTQYSGTFDGQNHKISGIYYSNGGWGIWYIGFFGCLSGTVKDLGIVDSYIYGSTMVGAIAGQSTGTIQNCYSDSYVSGFRVGVGGITGNNEGTLSHCYNSGLVVCPQYVGGISGYTSGYLAYCFNSGEVRANGNASCVGGIAGRIERGSILGCYNIGTINTTASSKGSIVGFKMGGEVTKCYYLDTCAADGNATAATTKQFASGEVTYAITREEFFKRINEKSPLRKDDLDHLRDLLSYPKKIFSNIMR